MKFRDRKRRHDDAHFPLGGRGKKATPPRKRLNRFGIDKDFMPGIIQTAANNLSEIALSHKILKALWDRSEAWICLDVRGLIS